MNRDCACGGRLIRTDIRSEYGRDEDGRVRQMIVDTDPKVAHWRCDKCGVERTQRKRQAANKKWKKEQR